jgi:hypothetical protein
LGPDINKSILTNHPQQQLAIMAPAPLTVSQTSAINHKRAILGTLHSGGLTTSGKVAIGCAVTVLVLFIIGLGFFIYFYVRAARHHEPAHLGPFAFSHKVSSSKAGLGGAQTISEKQSFGSTSANSSSAAQPPLPLVDTPPGTSGRSTPKPEGDDLLNSRPRLHQLDKIPQVDHRASQASQQSTMSLEHPPTPGSEFV